MKIWTTIQSKLNFYKEGYAYTMAKIALKLRFLKGKIILFFKNALAYTNFCYSVNVPLVKDNF